MPLSGGAVEGGPTAAAVTVADVSEHIRISCGLPSAGPTVGAEVEWLVADLSAADSRPSVPKLEGLLADIVLPGGSRISFEPGGQVELSSVPARTPDEAHAGLLADIAVLRPALRAGGLDLVAAPNDSARPPIRVSESPRYEAMERYFAAGGWTTAPQMMCNTASIQVNVGCGADPSATWQRANGLAPILAAAFACSPADGWASARLRSWAEIDPSRTASAFDSGDATADWTQYALAATAIMRVGSDGGFEALPDGLTLREWIEAPPNGCGPPTMSDVELHLSTLFPPARLKGWIELRVIDMQPGEWWPVPLAVTAALLAPAGPVAHAHDFDWLDEYRDLTWQEAGRLGMGSPRLAAAANETLRLARARLDEQGSALTGLVERFRLERVEPALAGGRRRA
ncbi:MAG TPA: glutamate-cysteine ligase family protein [Acidimicrobiales bacterium]|nr:glutamate-cysteine ligase family protein [Acidimicrobiales bacterium]